MQLCMAPLLRLPMFLSPKPACSVYPAYVQMTAWKGLSTKQSPQTVNGRMVVAVSCPSDQNVSPFRIRSSAGVVLADFND